MTRRTLAPSLVLAACMGFSRAAWAGDAALAETLFRDGRALMDKGDYAAACPKLKESFTQDPATGTLLALGMCQEQAGQTASAWVTFGEAATRAKRDGRADREEAARERMAALEPKLSRLTIDVDPSSASLDGLVVKRDGVAVGKPAWGSASPVDPGEHVIEATAPGKKPWKSAVTIGATADNQSVKIPALEEESGAARAVSPSAPAAATTGEAGVEPGAASEGFPLRTVGLVTLGAGIVGLGVGTIFALRASSLNSDSKTDNHCDANNLCDPTGLEKRNDAISAANVATIGFVAGGVLAAAGVTLFIVGAPKDAKADSARVEAAPAMGPGVAGMLVSGRF